MAEDGSRRRLSPAGMIGGLIALVVLVPRRTSGMPIPLLRSESDLMTIWLVSSHSPVTPALAGRNRRERRALTGAGFGPGRVRDNAATVEPVPSCT